MLCLLTMRALFCLGFGREVRVHADSQMSNLDVLTFRHRVNIIDADTGEIVSTLPAENVFEIGFSPKGTYIITWQRSSKDENGDAVKNLKVWLVIDEKALAEGVEKETVGRFVQKSQTGWNLQYTYDEKFCARVVTNEVQIYQSHDLTTVWNKIRVEGVAEFAVSPGENHAIAVFVPERKVSLSAITRIGIQGLKVSRPRDNRPPFECSTSQSSPPRSRRRISSRATRSR